MCLDLLEELATASREAATLKAAQEKFRANRGKGIVTLELTDVEADLIFTSRVEAAEAKLKNLGWVPPAKRVAEGDREKELEAAGHTLPGKLPAQKEVEPELPAWLSAEQGAP